MTLNSAFLWRSFAAIATGLLLSACQSSPTLPDCTDPIGCVTIPPGEPIKLAVLQTLTGDSANIGQDQLNTINLVLSKRDYQILGHPIELQEEDELCTPEGGANATLRVVADPQIVAILGTTCSGAAKTASEIMSEAGLVMISSANTAPALTSVEGIQGDHWHPGYFRVIYNDAIAGRTAAEFAIEKLGITKAATIDDGEFYGQQLTSVFAQVFEELGGEVVLRTSLNLDAEDMTPFLEALDNAEAEFVFMPITASPATRLLEQVNRFPNLVDINGKGLIFLVGEELISDDFIQNIGETDKNGTSLYFAGPSPLNSPENNDLALQYEAQYNTLPATIFHSFASDATQLLLLSIARSTTEHSDGTLVIERQKLRDKLHATKAFNGITGQLKCDEFGDCGLPNLSIFELADPSTGVEGLKQNIVYTYSP